MNSSHMEVWLFISKKKPYGWRVASVNMVNLRKLMRETESQTRMWQLFSCNPPGYQEEWALVLRGYKNYPVPSS